MGRRLIGGFALLSDSVLWAALLRLRASPCPVSATAGAARNRFEIFERGYPLQVFVRDNNVDQAIKALKKKMQREGIFREMKRRKSYEKPSERRAREKAEGIRRARKAARKQAQREGLLPTKRKKPAVAGRR